jgi:hypothetical protein
MPDGTGNGAINESPFIREINSPLPGSSLVNAVPVINIWGDVNHEQPQYSIASDGIANVRPDKNVNRNGMLLPPNRFLCDEIPLKARYQELDKATDEFVPKKVYGFVKPMYIAGTTYNAARAVVDFFTGNLAAMAWHLAGGVQWARGWSYIDAGAQTAYRKIIGAYKVEMHEFGFRIFGQFIGFRWAEEVPTASDAFIPEWSQKSPQSRDQLPAQGANHLMQANHENVRRAFETIFNRTDKEFEVKK